MSRTLGILIEKGIPMPAAQYRQTRKPRSAKYPLREMEVGDSFFVTDYQSAQTCRMMANRNSMKIVQREEGYGWRIWRVA